jgi:uncharacterized membrane protein
VIATIILFYASRLYRAGDASLQSAERAERVGSWLGAIVLIGLVVSITVYGYYDCQLDAAAARLDALSALGCNSDTSMTDFGVSEMCIRTAIDHIGNVTYAAGCKSWAGLIISTLLVL